jgi:membrane-bound metal-dependent hydrolase YbcI (DUF457 family)
MDIVTHAVIGLVMAAPCLDNLPLAVGLVIGSVMPDLDVLSRLFGKRAMILCHQGFRANQADHHRTRTFQEEFRELLDRYQIDYDEAYVWD